MTYIRRLIVSGLLGLMLGLLPLGSLSHAQSPVDCSALVRSVLNPRVKNSDAIFTMVTLNDRGIASSTVTRLYFLPTDLIGGPASPPIGRLKTIDRGALGIESPKYDFGLQAQVFSDRTVPGARSDPNNPGSQLAPQPFDRSRADDLAVEISVGSLVQVTLTLRSWNNTKVVLKPTCEAGGFLLASTPDVKYVMRVGPWTGKTPY